MSIKYAILGILNKKPSTGYELKKIIEESSILYWSGNNNQIYKALIQMHEEALVSSETIHQDGSPSKKVYTITETGFIELKQWVKSSTEAPEFKKTFLIQLAWSDILDDEELCELFAKYETELENQLIMEQEKFRRAFPSPDKSNRESFLWDMIYSNLISSYQNELNWVREARKKLLNLK